MIKDRGDYASFGSTVDTIEQTLTQVPNRVRPRSTGFINKYIRISISEPRKLQGLLRIATQLCNGDSAFLVFFGFNEYSVKATYRCTEGEVSAIQPLLEDYFHNEILSNEIKSVSVKEDSAFRFNGLLVPLSDAASNLIGCLGIHTADLSLTSSDTRNNLLAISEQVMDIFRAVLIKEELFAVKKQKGLSEKKIHEIENILNYTNENSPLGIVQTNTAGKLIYTNSVFDSIAGYVRRPSRESYWFEQVVEEEREGIRRAWFFASGEINSFNVQCRFRNIQGKVSVTSVSAKPIVTIDGSVKYLFFVTDITELVQEEERTRLEHEREQQSLRQKEKFLANMSHEIRTPMNAIIGFTEILQNSSQDPLQKEYIEIIRTAGANLLSIINDILDFSKIESGGMKTSGRRFTIEDIRRGVYDLLKLKAQEKQIELLFLPDEHLPEAFIGDITHLNQVLINLTNNAIKFTEKGFVAIEICLMEEDARRCTLLFRIKDTGPGISKQAQQLIFERFFQADNENTKQQIGSGLGLSISKSLVEEMGGYIELKSEEGAGSEFYFELRFNKAESAPIRIESRPEETLPPEDAHKIRLLLFEDNELNKQLVRHLVKEAGFQLDVAVNGVDGIQLVKENTYDLILMDLDMPVMDGYHATDMIRNELKISTPIIAMTAHTISGEREKCLSIGMCDFISKPIQKSSLIEKVFLHTKLQSTEPTPTPVAVNTPNHDNSGLNLSYLKSLSNGNEIFEREMMEVFIKTSPKKLELLRMAIDSGDFVRVRKQTHHLKGSIQIIGLDEVVPLLSEVDELSYHPENIDNMSLLCQNIENLIVNYTLKLRSVLQPTIPTPTFAEEKGKC